jgi:CHAT domain-containing protein
MPHITWCLTGPLTFLPIHAAGLYDMKDQLKIFDYVVSSYTPTLAALLSFKRRPPRSDKATRLLTISQSASPGQMRLPGTVDEVNAIQALQSRTGRLHITRLDDQEATVAAVLEHMKDCSWVHLACHGVQNTARPTDSAFLIDHPLTLKEIMKQSFTHTELAVLSACQTATGDSDLPEEAISLAAGMLMAGYGSVVGTMWSIRDDDAPIIAEKFYKYLIDEAGGDSGRAAYALHNAVAHLRDVRGENNFASWVPFIHLGTCSPPPAPPA